MCLPTLPTALPSLFTPPRSRQAENAHSIYPRTTRNATSNKLIIIIIFAQPLPLSSSRQGVAPADKQTGRQTEGRTYRRTDKQTERHLSLAANNDYDYDSACDSVSGHVLAAVERQLVSQGATRVPQRRRLQGAGALAGFGRLLSWPFVVNYILFINQHTHTHTHTLMHLHKDVLMMCLDYGTMDSSESCEYDCDRFQSSISRHLHNIKTKLVEP